MLASIQYLKKKQDHLPNLINQKITLTFEVKSSFYRSEIKNLNALSNSIHNLDGNSKYFITINYQILS